MTIWHIYGIFNKKNGELIYIGQTRRGLRRRFSQHRSWGAEFNERKVTLYMKQNGGYEEYEIESLKKCKTEYDALEWESHLILECDPPCNVYGKC